MQHVKMPTTMATQHAPSVISAQYTRRRRCAVRATSPTQAEQPPIIRARSPAVALTVSSSFAVSVITAAAASAAGLDVAVVDDTFALPLTAAAVVAAALAAAFFASSIASTTGGRRRIRIPTPRRGTGVSDESRSRRYLVFPPPLFPLVPAFSRQTFRYEIDPGRMWFFEQKQGIGLGLNVSVNVRMTVVKLKDGSLWVHAPIAPTAECIALLEQLDAPVKHIVLPTTLFEHKIYAGPFQRRYPNASMFVVPNQWSWPVNLPVTFFGITPTGILGRGSTSGGSDASPPWSDEIEFELLRPPALGVASYVNFTEAAFFIKATQTVLVTDAVVFVSDTPPDAVSDADLLESGDDDNFTIAALKFLNLFDIKTKAELRTNSSDTMSTEERLRLGWRRNALQALFFGPNNLLDPDASWAAVSNRLFVAPVVGTFVYENVPTPVMDWVQRVSAWNFTRIVPAHFDAPIEAGPKEWNAAFAFLRDTKPTTTEGVDGGVDKAGGKSGAAAYYPDDDMILLRGVEGFLKRTGVIFTDATRPTFGGGGGGR